jgi:hypothetical protein
MKIPPSRLLAASAMLLANTLLLLSPPHLVAQAPTATPSAGPKRDPFVKGASQPTPTPNFPTINVAFTVEVYALAQEDAVQVLAESGTGEARHDAVLRLMNARKAHLETLICLVGKSGQRSVVEAVDEVRYASAYWGGLPTNFETRNAGDTLEIEPTLDSDGKYCDLNMVMQRVHLAGFPFVTGDTSKPPFETQVKFTTGKITTSMTMTVGETEFLGTLSNPPPFAERAQKPEANDVRLAFGRINTIDLGDSGSKGEPFVPYLEMQITFYSLDREAARQILGAGFEGEACYNAVKALADKGQAKLEHVTVLKTKSGQRAVVEAVDEMRYPTEYRGSGGQPVPSAFEIRNTGFTWEIEPTIDSSGTILDLNQVPQFVTYEGLLQVNGAVPQIEPQPLFETQKLTSSMTMLLNKESFIGTFSEPGDDGVNGRKDTGRTWFGFVKGTL